MTSAVQESKDFARSAQFLRLRAIALALRVGAAERRQILAPGNARGLKLGVPRAPLGAKDFLGIFRHSAAQ
jgi:hypothetical protein